MEAYLTVRVMIVDNHRIMRQGLRSLIEKEAGIEVCGEAADGRSAVIMAHEIKPDVIIMDVTLPVLNGIEATRQIVADCPSIKVLILSMHFDRRFVEGALDARASGYLLKECAFEEVVQAIETVMAGQTYLSFEVQGGAT